MSLRNIKAHLRQTLDAAVRSGYPRDHFKTLSDLIDLEVLGGAAEHIIGRNGERAPSSLLNILATLLAIARYHVGAADETIKGIAAAKSNVAEQLGGAPRSMSQKSQRRMDQFVDDDNVARIIDLPNQLIRRANRSPGSQRASMEAMVAAAIAFLLACPALRMANLAALNTNEDLTATRRASRSFSLFMSFRKRPRGGRRSTPSLNPLSPRSSTST